MGNAPERFRFGPFEVDEALFELRRHDQRVPLQRRPLEVLLHLVRERHRVVPKVELMERVWGGVVVSDAALSSALRDLRRALDDDGRSQHTIQTHHGFGYRFVAPVEWGGGGAPAAADAPPAGVDADWWTGFSQRLAAFVTAELAAAGSDAASESAPVRLVRVR